MANNLPTNIASIGIAAAMTSMILFDFSSISWDSTMPDRSKVRKNSSIWPIVRGYRAILGERAGDAVDLGDAIGDGHPRGAGRGRWR